MLKVVIISDWFAEKMGYAENLLPKAMAKMPGLEVHVITTDMQPAYENYQQVYEPFIGPRRQQTGAKQLFGFTLHRLPHGIEVKGRGIYIKGLKKLLLQIKPDIVQCFCLNWLGTYQAAWYKKSVGYKLFLEDHTHQSVFSIPTGRWAHFKLFIKYKILGRWLGRVSELCYPIAEDVKELIITCFGYPANKTKIVPLGVDTDIFSPALTPGQQEERKRIRAQFGFNDNDIVCVYSGRFSNDKKPVLLAQAIDLLQERTPRFKALLIGSGTSGYLNNIQACSGVKVHDFVQWYELAAFYRACDIGVWPSQESTSQVDASACGLPLILSNRIQVLERVNGNGLLYEEDNVDSLAEKILALEDAGQRHTMGETGRMKVEAEFSWNKIAAERVNDYKNSMQ